MTILTTTKAKENLASLVRKSHNLGEKYIITHKGEKYSILLSSDEYEGLIETLDILKDNKTVKEIVKSLKDIEEGKTYTFEEVVGRKQKK